MDDESLKKVIDYGIDKYFKAKADKEIKTKLEAEADEQSKNAAKDMEKNFSIVLQTVLIIITVIGCYVFLKNTGVL